MNRSIELIVELLSKQRNQAPGSAETTRKALGYVNDLPVGARIADMGCGRGASAVVLAKETSGSVVAIDLLEPMVAATEAAAKQAHLTARLTAHVGDIGAPPFEPASLDMIWSEGAAYNIGLDNALATWTPLLRIGGSLVVSELCWSGEPVSSEIRAYWAEAYPDIRSADACIAACKEVGLEVVQTFRYPEKDWAAYYDGVEAALPGFCSRHPADEVADAVANEMRTEARMWRTHGKAWDYLFVIARRV